MTGTAASAWIVCADREEAQRIARVLVDERLAACCNVLGECASVYRWEGEIETATEVPVVAKTTLERSDALIARVKDLHSYDVPAVTIWPVAKIPDDYARWIEVNTAPSNIA